MSKDVEHYFSDEQITKDAEFVELIGHCKILYGDNKRLREENEKLRERRKFLSNLSSVLPCFSDAAIAFVLFLLTSLSLLGLVWAGGGYQTNNFYVGSTQKRGYVAIYRQYDWGKDEKISPLFDDMDIALEFLDKMEKRNVIKRKISETSK